MPTKEVVINSGIQALIKILRKRRKIIIFSKKKTVFNHRRVKEKIGRWMGTVTLHFSICALISLTKIAQKV